MRNRVGQMVTATMFILALILVGRISIPMLRADDDDHGCSPATLHGGYGSGTTGLINSSTDPNAIHCRPNWTGKGTGGVENKVVDLSC
jgi:hypothetical protein